MNANKFIANESCESRYRYVCVTDRHVFALIRVHLRSFAANP